MVVLLLVQGGDGTSIPGADKRITSDQLGAELAAWEYWVHRTFGWSSHPAQSGGAFYFEPVASFSPVEDICPWLMAPDEVSKAAVAPFVAPSFQAATCPLHYYL